MNEKDETTNATTNATTLDDVYPIVDAGGFDEEQKEAKIKPLPDDWYLWEILDYEVSLSGEASKVPGTPYVRFMCSCKDKDPECDGRKVRTRPQMLRGPGFKFFVGDGENLTGFVEMLTPSRGWDPKKGVRLLNADGKSEYLDSFVGCEVAGKTEKDTDLDGNVTGWNTIVEFNKK